MPSEREVLDHLVAKHDPQAVILVGSRVDDRARPGSDWDLYVVLGAHPAGIKGPVPAPDTLDGDALDVGIVHLPLEATDVGVVFGPNLQQAKILLDNASGDADRICAHARRLYAAGRGLTKLEIAERKHEMERNLARMKSRSDEPGPFFEALTYLFYTAHRYWYEVLHDRWSVSVHRAMPEIAREDPHFHRHLQALIDGPRPESRIRAAEAIYNVLFHGD